MSKKWKHDELAEDLARAKGGIPYLNVCLGSPLLNGRELKTPRADLIVCKPSYNRFCLSIFEIKVSRSDFLSDIRTEKWRDYLPHCDRFYFAVCKGVLKTSDIPEEAGLIIRGEKGWRTVKSPIALENDIPINTIKSLIFAKQRRSTRERNLDYVRDIGRDYEYARKYYTGSLKAAKLFGKDLGILHEAAMNIGGLPKAVEVLKSGKFE